MTNGPNQIIKVSQKFGLIQNETKIFQRKTGKLKTRFRLKIWIIEMTCNIINPFIDFYGKPLDVMKP